MAFRNLPLRAKGLLVVAIPLAALLGVTAGFYLLQPRAAGATGQMQRAAEIRSRVQAIRANWEAAEASGLGYLGSREPEWLKTAADSEDRVSELFGDLERLVAPDPSKARRVALLRAAVTERVIRWRDLPKQLDGPPATSGLSARLAAERSAQAALRQDLIAFRKEAEADMLRWTRREQEIRRAGSILTAAGLLLAPAAAIFAMLLFTAAIARRTEQLGSNARRLAQGQTLIPTPPARDEIGALERDLQHTADLLARREAELRQAAAQLETRVVERTAELETANLVLAATDADLDDANRKMEAIIHATPLAIVGLDLENRVMEWNRAAEQMFGWTADEVLGAPLPTVPPEEEASFAAALEQAGPDGVVTYDGRRRTKDGRMVEVRIWSAPLKTAGGETRGRIAVVADITEQRGLERQFAQAQKMEAIGRLAGGVAHDFNNVITVVSGYGHMLLEGVEHDPALREAAEEVLKSADRAAGLARQLLAFSRRQSIQPQVLDLNGLVSNMQRMLARVIGEDVELKTVLAPDIAAVKADPGQLEQVLMNLAVNARDAMPGGGRLTVETANVELDEHYARTHAGVRVGPHVMLAVSDNGTGMDRETQAHLFEPFYTTKDKGKGTGLGLSTVYGIVKQHGGDVWVYSEPGRGSTFKVYLPAVAGQAAQTTQDRHRQTARGGSETVLLVEDEERVRRLIHDILAQRGYQVLEAGSGEDALNLAGRHAGNIDLLVTDIVLPHMNGRAVSDALQLLRPDLKTLFLSGYTDQVVLDQGALAAGSAFLQKPFSPDTLAKKVREVLDTRSRAGHS